MLEVIEEIDLRAHHDDSLSSTAAGQVPQFSRAFASWDAARETLVAVGYYFHMRQSELNLVYR